ncbi:transcriptional regulator, AraC family [Caldicellulosiruptor obsidiansis OB47]|uniref:Transcriptional regulator, AraC family n=2 Tax=Caldicellulosiruptor TaxID=44000 RepID=D9TFH4_CALOO|nr:transcriptional regulator, AraC family [Caldicellulosiruptor obsidiansis OB47]
MKCFLCSKKNVNVVLFFLSIMIFVLPFLLSVFLLDLSKSLLIKDKINNNLILLNKLRDKVDYELKEMNEIVTRVLTNGKLIWVGNLWDLRENSSDLWEYFEYYKHFECINWINGELKPIVILFLRKGEIIYFTSEEFGSFFTFGFKNFYNYFSPYRMDFRVWYNEVFNKSNDKSKNKLKSHEFQINGKKISALYTTFDIPSNNSDNLLGILQVIIDINKFQKLLSENELSRQGSAIFIYDKGEKKILASNRADVNKIKNSIIKILNVAKNSGSNPYDVVVIQNIRYVFLRLTSNVCEWDYIYLVPYNNLENEIYSSKAIYRLYQTGFTFYIILMGLFIIYLKKGKGLIKQLTSSLKNVNMENENKTIFFEKLNEIEEKEHEISNHKSTNSEIINIINLQQEVLNDMIIEKLVYGWFHNEETMERNIQSVGLKVRGKKYLVAIIRVLSYNQQVRLKDIIKKDFKDIEIDARISLVFYYVYQLTDNDFAIIMAFDEDDEEKVKQSVDLLLKSIGGKLEIEVCGKCIMTVGRIFDTLSECKLSFLDAKELIELYKFTKTGNIEKGVVWYYDTEEKNDIWYPIEIEEKLMSLANLGKTSEIEEILNLLYYKNFAEKNISLSMKYLLITELIGTIVKIAKRSKLNIENLCDVKKLCFVIEENIIDRLFEDIKQVFINIAEKIRSNRKASKEKLIEEILEFINKNAFNPNMGISFVAERFNLCDSYFSHIFKEAVGVKFSDYVEKLRIEEACKLIKLKKWNLEEISKMVGFTNIKTFRRAFKRVKGYLPSEMFNINEEDT